MAAEEKPDDKKILALERIFRCIYEASLLRDSVFKQFQTRPTCLVMVKPLIACRAQAFDELTLNPGKFVGSVESACSYSTNKRGNRLTAYRIPQGYYLVLNSSDRVEEFDAWFTTNVVATRR